MLKLRVYNLGDVTIFRCEGRITLMYADSLRIAALKRRIRFLMLDLAEVSAIDAAGLGVLVSLQTWATKTGTTFKLMNLVPRVQHLLELTGLSSTF